MVLKTTSYDVPALNLNGNCTLHSTMAQLVFGAWQLGASTLGEEAWKLGLQSLGSEGLGLRASEFRVERVRVKGFRVLRV